MLLSDALGIASLGVSVAGFSFAAIQLKRTADASEATEKAVQDTARRLSLNHLLVLLPQLRSIEAELDVAASENDRSLAIRTLVSYSHTATQVAALLEQDSDTDQALVTRLRTSAKTAGAAKSVLVSTKNKSVAITIKYAAEQIADMASHATGLVVAYQVKAG